MSTRRALLGIVLVLAAAACCPAAGTGAQGAGAAAGVGPGDWRTDTAPPARAMLEVARRLAELQFVPTGQEGRSFIVKGSTLSVPLQTEAGRCYVFASTSSRDLVDLDSYLFQASGAEVDQDRRRDNHPTIRYCPTETGAMYLLFEPYDGNGLFYWAVFSGPADAQVSVADLFPDVGPEPASPDQAQPVETEPMEDRARTFAEIMMPRGFAIAEQEGPLHVASGETETRSLELTVDRCYTFAAYGGSGATDVDLYLTAPDGQVVALDEDPALDAYVQWCPVVTGTFEVKVQMASQGGDALLVRLEAQSDRVGGLDGLWLGTRRPPGPTHRGIDEGATQMDSRLEELGYRVDDAGTLEGEAQQLEIRTHTLTLSADKCHIFGAVGGPDVSDLDLFLYDRQGNEVARDEALNATPVLQVCPQQSETFRLDVAMRGGNGPYKVLRGLSPAIGAEAQRGLDTVARTRLRTVVDRIHLVELTPLGSPQTTELRERGVKRYQNNLTQGDCYLFVAVGAQSVVDIDLYVMDADGALVGRDDQPDAAPSVRFCASRTGAYSSDVRLIEGSGQFTLLQYRTPAAASGTATPAAGGTP